MAGEDSQGDRQVLAASDLWSCGIVIYVRGRADEGMLRGSWKPTTREIESGF